MANETTDFDDATELRKRLSPLLETINALSKEDLISVLDFVFYSLGGRSRCPDDQSRGCPCVFATIAEEMIKPYQLGAERATLLEHAHTQVNTQAKRGEA